MAVSFLNTVQSLANSLASDKNGFTWDSAIRKFQYGVAGIMLAALTIYDSTSTMKCTSTAGSLLESYYVSSYCSEATWYHISNDTNVPYDECLRDLKWYILIPPIVTIISAVLFGALVDSYVIQAIKRADEIMKLWSAKIEGSTVTMTTGNDAVNTTLLNMAIRARVFAETNIHYKNDATVTSPAQTSSDISTGHPSYGSTEECDKTELFRVNYSHLSDKNVFSNIADKIGAGSALYYQLYLVTCMIINLVAAGFINPHYFWFPPQIMCNYIKEDLSTSWAICSVPGHRYSRAALIIVLGSYIIGVLVTWMSLIYLNAYVPKQFLKADAAISSYTRDTIQQEKLLDYWRSHGKEKVKDLSATSRYLLALIYQCIDRSLCFRLIIAMLDIEKDKYVIEKDLPKLIEELVDIDTEFAGVYYEDREAKINEIRRTILYPVGADQMKENIQSNVLVKWVGAFLDNPAVCTRELLKAQQIHRVTGVQLPKQCKGMKKQLCNLIQQKRESDFANSVEYYRFLSAIYDISKIRNFFAYLEAMDIGKLSDAESHENIIDNGHVVENDHAFNAAKAFDTSGYCWRTTDATSYNWIRRSWDERYDIKLVAIQGSHTNELATPIHFNFTAKLEHPGNGKVLWENVSETFRSYDWLKDEWRVFPVVITDNDGNQGHPRSNAIQINLFKNGGARYFEIQKIKIFGTSN